MGYSKYTKDKTIRFVTDYGDAIIAGITDSGLFFPAVVAQLSVESQWGESYLSVRYNNYGGIKATGSVHSSGKVLMDTTEVVKGKEVGAREYFATYADFKKFIADYIRVLKLPHFVNAGVFTAADPLAQILAMAKGGYSTRNPQEYVRFCEGRVEACIDLYPWGKINTSAPVPVQPSASGFMQGVLDSIAATFKKPAA